MSQESKGRKTRSAKAAKGKGGPERLKVSLLLHRDNDIRLTVLASVRGTDRSTLINEILSAALKGVVISLRNGLGDGAGGMTSIVVGDDTPEAA